MYHYGYEEIVDLAKTEPYKKLRLHWEGNECEAETTTPYSITAEVSRKEYTPEQFDKIGYCVSEEDYQEEQNQEY